MTTDPQTEPDLTETQKAYNVAQSDMFQLAAYGHHRYHPLVEALTDEGKRQQRDYNDRLLAARDELEAALLRLVAEHAETFPGERGPAWLRSLADDPAALSLLAVRPDERDFDTDPAVSSAVARSAPAETALRDRIAALFRHPPGAERLGDATPGEIADAVLAVLPASVEEHRLALSDALGLGTGAPWDAIHDRVTELALPPLGQDPVARRLGLVAEHRATVLNEALVAMDAHLESFFREYPEERQNSPWVLGWKDATAELQRIAVEAQQRTDTPECSASLSGNCLREAESETACDTEAGECVHGGRPATETPACPDPIECGHEAALGQAQVAVAELAQALRLTREYVGEELLPPVEGWSWYDALRRHAPHELPAVVPAGAGEEPADETREAEAHPPTHTWKVESPRRDKWASWGATHDERVWAAASYDDVIEVAPQRPFRLVRATTTYAVEAEHQPAAVSQPGKEH